MVTALKRDFGANSSESVKASEAEATVKRDFVAEISSSFVSSTGKLKRKIFDKSGLAYAALLSAPSSLAFAAFEMSRVSLEAMKHTYNAVIGIFSDKPNTISPVKSALQQFADANPTVKSFIELNPDLTFSIAHLSENGIKNLTAHYENTAIVAKREADALNNSEFAVNAQGNKIVVTDLIGAFPQEVHEAIATADNKAAVREFIAEYTDPNSRRDGVMRLGDNFAIPAQRMASLTDRFGFGATKVLIYSPRQKEAVITPEAPTATNIPAYHHAD